MQKGEPLRRFVTGMPKGRFEPALASATLCGLLVQTDDQTGKATDVQMFRHGGRLQATT
ncbi:MAG: metallophosphoesterase, partial [Planktomarina sp.]